MVIKNKGYQTKERLLGFAKQEFYEKGYKEAWLQSIAQNANVRLGNLNYYFPKKDDLVKEIYSVFFHNITEHSAYQKNKNDYNSLENFCCFTCVVYTIIFSDDKNLRFYQEVIDNKSNYRILHDLMYEHYIDIIQSMNITLKGNDFDVFLLTEFGSRREIFLSYFDRSLNITFNELISYLISNTCKCLGIDNEVTRRMIEVSFAFVDNHDFSDIKFLV